MESDDIPHSEPSRAREFIEELGEDNGFFEEHYWNEFDEGRRAKFQRAIRSLQGKLEPAIKALAKSLYSSSARFIFELLQNAEDNNFRHAQSRPYVSFRLSEDQLVIECNEDGFTPANLKAICSIGKSSKSATEGYIGEKGIGFKSVFMAAWKVHIQSGPYSFYFQHRPSDSGIGMVTPIWQEPTEELPQHMTRMTLHLHTEGDHGSISAQRDNVRQQLRELSGNVLLFMRKLKVIRIVIDEDGTTTSTVFSKSETDGSRIRILKTVTQDDGNSDTSSTLYHITKRQVHNLSKNENRTYSEEEDRLREYSTAEVVLAFPLTPEHEPVIESQEVFAFLPVQTAGFSFLIQSDFMTNASREHIVATSARNIGLRDGICAAFMEAALEFCSHKSLQYTWMKFLPDSTNKAYSDFWSVLVTKIEATVRETPLIRPDSGGPSRTITSLYNLRPMFADKENNLLLRDLDPELSISRHYENSSLAILKTLGLRDLSWWKFIEMVDQDLQSSDSWIKSRISEDYRQTNVADLLIQSYKAMKGNWVGSMIEKLPIIPLEDDRWLAATTEEKIFFPDTAGLTVPGDLEFNLIESSVATHPKWRELFGLLGVESLSVGTVRERIFQRHISYWKDPGESIKFYAQQLKFLYSTHDPRSHTKDIYWMVVLLNDSMAQIWRTTRDIYLPDNDPLGPRELLKPTLCDDNSTEGAPGFEVDFIHKSYLEDVPKPPRQASLTWRDWLVEVIGVRRLLRLVNNSFVPTDLSDACYYVAKHRPEKFFAFLHHHWLREGRLVIQNLGVEQKLREITVLCQGKQMLKLQDTCIPFPDLLSESTRFLAAKVDFPFLQLEEPIQGYHWKTLHSLMFYLGIKGKTRLDFYLKILLVFSTVQYPTEDDSRRALELYSVIHGKYLQDMFKDHVKEFIQSRFKENSMILVPSADEREFKWTPLADCLWEAPSCLRSRYPLKARMKSFLAEFSSLPNFFVDVLEIPDCDYSHIMQELEYLSDNGDSQQEIVSSLYRELSRMSKGLPTNVRDDIKSTFVNKNLIYAEKDGHGAWYQVAECLWASKSDFTGWAILEPHYKDLHKFFVEFLGVKVLSLELVYKELDLLGSSSDTTRDQVEPNIWLLNSFLSAKAQPLDAKTLLTRRIFPVRYPDGHVQLEKATVEFAIVNRAQLGHIFKPMTKTLDFDLDQVRRLRPTLSWLGLGTRYISEAIWEVSRVQGASKEPLSNPARGIKPRAHALYRIAYHYNSPRLNEGTDILYETLRNAQVYETDGIAATLYIKQDGRERSYEKGQSDLHIEEEEGKLNVFVPRDKRSQESCYARKLPLGLFRWLMTPSDGGRAVLSEKGLRVTASVLNSSRFVLSDILEDEGITAGELEDDYKEDDYEVEEEGAGSSDEDQIDTPALAETEVEETPGPEEAVYGPSFTPRTANREVATGLPVPYEPAQSRQSSSPNLAQDVSYIQTRSDVAIARHQPAIQSIPSVSALIDPEEAQYQALLERVVTAARGSLRLPSQGAYDMTGMSHALSDLMGHSSYDGVDQFLPFRSSSQQERDRKIGAAGELYVLPDFSLQNWKSTIRKYVSPHPDYVGIQPWNHRETSDLEYADSEGALTELMIDNGYLERDIWENKKPRYYLEVKTTTGPCEAPFYMSKSQYRLMHECQDSTDEIYVVFRVYEVEKAAVQLRVYVNPARLEDMGRLIYTAETWSVRPGAGA
ncbi:hypothetical protein LCI18_008138 [Fusarium solani-melongenae]|uniref:Uncharacterized protein n=1 Tax=Fusarium solani subsp. cucurbitae TaxID=2747967 RepID=A0ACD3ZAU3_FUSSC|nr:hypothetical protein LCI18_008138 [Fusarium solani-melongenae]